MDSLIFLVKSVSEFQVAVGNDANQLFALCDRDTGNTEFCHQFIGICKGMLRDNEKDLYDRRSQNVFTLSTSSACASMDIFLWIIPIPPCLAIAIAILCSVTVSIPALISGMFSLIFLSTR